MRAGDVPAEWIDAFNDAFEGPWNAAMEAARESPDGDADVTDAYAAGIAAVAPQIARAALERAARLLDASAAEFRRLAATWTDGQSKAGLEGAARALEAQAAAIRALPDE